MSILNKLPWHPPRIVEDIMLSPAAGQLSLSTGNPGNPHNGYKVLNRDEHKAQGTKARVDNHRARLKKKSSFLKKPLPYSVFREIDAVAIKILEGNPRDADGKLISFEEAQVLAIADIVKAARKICNALHTAPFFACNVGRP
jgi:hypothetical protein